MTRCLGCFPRIIRVFFYYFAFAFIVPFLLPLWSPRMLVLLGLCSLAHRLESRIDRI